jgi:hypothetical protein
MPEKLKGVLTRPDGEFDLKLWGKINLSGRGTCNVMDLTGGCFKKKLLTWVIFL